MLVAENRQTGASGPDAGRSDAFKVPRLLYYLAMLLLGELVQRGFADLTISDLVFFAALLIVLLMAPVLRAERSAFLPTALLFGLLLFAIGSLFSSLGSPYRLQSLESGARFVYLTLIWFWLGTVVLRTVNQVAMAVGMWTASAGICGLAAVGQLYEAGPSSAVDFGGRLTGFTGHPNDLGGVAAVALVPAIMLTTTTRTTRIPRLAAVVVLTCIVAALILSGSVESLIAGLGGVGLWIALARVRARQLVFVLGVAATVGLFLVSQESADAYSPLNRIAHVTGQSTVGTSTLQSRVDTDQEAASAIAKHPLIGLGLDLDSTAQEVSGEVHNMFLYMALGAGLPALIGIFVILAALAVTGRSIVADARSKRERLLGIALSSSLFSFVIFALAAPVVYKRYCWVPAALLIALRAIQQRRMVRHEY